MRNWANNQIPPQGDAQPEHVLATHTFQSKGSFVKKTGTMPDNTNKSTAPNGSPLVGSGTITFWPAKGYYDGTSSKLVINDVNIDPANVKVDVNLLGIDGTFTADADATADDIRQGKTAYVNGVKITGTAVF